MQSNDPLDPDEGIAITNAQANASRKNGAFPIFLLLSLLALAAACGPGRRGPYRETAEIMGTTFAITIEGFGQPERAARAAFEEIRRIDRLLSTYKDGSEISEVNRNAPKGPIAVGPDFWEVALASHSYYQLSGGSFDPTVYPLMQLWGFRKREGRIPTDEELGDTLPLIDFGKVALDESARAVGFEQEGMALDFGGIAKGYAVDRAVAVLGEMGVTHAIVDAGGNFYALGVPRDREHWRAGIRHPLRREEIIARLPMADKGAATSGSYERFFEIGGKKYCHIMDPRTGRPVEGMLSATVIADTAMAADALSTAVFVLGKEKGLQLIEGLPGVEGMLIVQETDSPEGFRIVLSSGLLGKIELLLPVSP